MISTRHTLLSFALLSLILISGCKEETVQEGVRPVRAMTVKMQPVGERSILTGQIAAQNTIAASFRIGGKVIERTVSVGDAVHAGQVLAILDSKTENDSLKAANAEVAAAKATLEQAEKNEKRSSTLSKVGAMSVADNDAAQQTLKSARAQLEAAEAKQRIAQEQVGYTTLLAEIDGIVTEKDAEPSETVAAGQVIVRIAQDRLKDAVFDVPEAIVRQGLSIGQTIDVKLATATNVSAAAKLREIAPQADPNTRTYQVKATLADAPDSMLLGATIIGELQRADEKPAIRIPSSSLSLSEGKTAVWLVNAKDMTLEPRQISVARYENDSVIVEQGLDDGAVIVTAGTQSLYKGQKVRLLGAP